MPDEGPIIRSELPTRIGDYVDTVSREAGRPVNLVRVKDPPRSGTPVALQLPPAEFAIHVWQGLDVKAPAAERLVVHELTRGRLLYARGYVRLEPAAGIAESERQSLVVVSTMVDDVVVNAVMQREGFTPYDNVYMEEMARETRSAEAGKDHYVQFSFDPAFKRRFMIFRYVLAWGTLQYLTLSSFESRRINRFLKAFAKAYPKTWQASERVQGLFTAHDAFTAAGHRDIVGGVLSDWSLAHAATLVSP